MCGRYHIDMEDDIYVAFLNLAWQQQQSLVP